MKKKRKLKFCRSSLTNLSNEIFYEIFDYLDGYDIYRSFTKLNQRFENLLHDSSYLMKIKIDSSRVFNNDYRKFIEIHTNHIRSFHFYDQNLLDQFISSMIIRLTCNRLESIVLNQISTYKFVILLFYLKTLPNLFSLRVNFDYFEDSLVDIYHMIYHLPALKYLQIGFESFEEFDCDPLLMNKQMFSSIEYLVISHPCPLHQLFDLISYTPRLSHLYCSHLIESIEEFDDDLILQLPKLVHFSCVAFDIDFDDFEKYLMKISSQLKVLSLMTGNCNRDYLDSYRWKRFIDKHLTQLIRLTINFTDLIDQNFHMDSIHQLIQGFLSPFWIDHQWIFRIAIQENQFIYLIRPYKETWLEYHQYPQVDYPPVTQLFIDGTLLDENNQPFFHRVYPLLNVMLLTSLDIQADEMSMDMFVEILDSLPKLRSIRLQKFSFAQLKKISFSHRKIWKKFLRKNQIEKITLRAFVDIPEVIHLIGLFPRMKSLSLQYIFDENLRLFLQCIFILMGQTRTCDLTNICLETMNLKTDPMEELKQVMDSEGFLCDYSVHRKLNRIYLIF